VNWIERQAARLGWKHLEGKMGANLKRWVPVIGTAGLALSVILRMLGKTAAADAIGGFVDATGIGAQSGVSVSELTLAIGAACGVGLKLYSQIRKALGKDGPTSIDPKRFGGAALVALVLLPGLVFATIDTNNNVSVTSTATSIRLGTLENPATQVLVINDTASANELYFRLYVCGGQNAPAAATTTGVRVEKGESRSLAWTGSAGGAGYCSISLVCDAAETATARVEWQ
jgi:hypothetical protein